ncbi:MAG: NUDIX domain-containing protein [Pyrinomonadaceae bacterium]
MPYKPLATIYRLLFPLIRFYWSITHAHIRGVRCLIEHQGQLIMVRQTYGERFWTFPGGLVGRRESAENAALREVWEEVGVTPQEIHFLGSFTTTDSGFSDTVYCFSGRAARSDFEIDSNEIQEAEWFDLKDLPEPLSLHAREALGLYWSDKGASKDQAGVE